MTQNDTNQNTAQDVPFNDNLTGHNYDGIEEYDNPTPGWWTWLFLASVVFAAAYMFVTLMSQGELTPHGQYERATNAYLAKFGSGGLQEDAASLLTYMKAEKQLATGKSVYIAKCLACHGANGEGIAGPNLTDDLYVHVNEITDILDVVRKGRANGAMPPWEKMLSPAEIVQVSVYVAAMRGKNVSGGIYKTKPEAKEIPPWE